MARKAAPQSDLRARLSEAINAARDAYRRQMLTLIDVLPLHYGKRPTDALKLAAFNARYEPLCMEWESSNEAALRELDAAIELTLELGEVAMTGLDALPQRWTTDLLKELRDARGSVERPWLDGPYSQSWREELIESLRVKWLLLAHAPPVLPAVDGPNDSDADAMPTDPTMRDLATEAGISNDTFRRVRLAAGIEVKLKGAAARNRRYSPIDVDRLIAAARAGNFIERTAMAEKWTKWGSKKAASKPHAGK